ncbi:MAG TPA: Tm-1-like ATP-binding domain-containing protein [Gemmataceae bacterium]|jgi:uncharacterized protein (UPF0261 family)
MSELPIAVTTGPLTRPCADAVRRLLAEQERPVREYVTDGAGGRALEADVLAGRVAAVVDVSLAELAAELAGTAGGAGPDRLTAAALRGVPQVIVPGELDAVLGPNAPPDRPVIAHDRQWYRPTTLEECDELGREIANKASASRGPVVILVPRGGFSELHRPFALAGPAGALVQSLRNWVSPSVQVRELNLHVNDPEFAAAAVAALNGL